MTAINSAVRPLSINQCANLISTTGDSITYIIVSEPGVGKSSILDIMRERYGDSRRYVYLDIPNIRDGDLFMQMPNRETGKLEQYLADHFDRNDPRPVVVMVDEIFKAPRSMRPLFTRFLLEKQLGDYKLPAGSIVFGTSNNVTDGVDDTLRAHEGNRVSVIPMRKPTTVEYCVWAAKNGVSSLTRALVTMTPRLMASYTDGPSQAGNELIFNPKTNNKNFASPRSMTKVDVVIRNRATLDEDMVYAALAGACGEAYAKLMTTFIEMEKDLIPPMSVIDDPVNTPVPEKKGALWMLMFNMTDVIKTQDDLTAAVTYIERAADREVQAVFNTMLLNDDRTAGMATRNSAIKEWMVTNRNYKLLAN
jgi:hypothetical protein